MTPQYIKHFLELYVYVGGISNQSTRMQRSGTVADNSCEVAYFSTSSSYLGWFDCPHFIPLSANYPTIAAA